MVEYLIVALIVAAASFYVLKKYLPRSLRARLFGKAALKDDGCGSADSGGCGSCGSGCGTPPAPRADGQQVIEIRSR